MSLPDSGRRHRGRDAGDAAPAVPAHRRGHDRQPARRRGAERPDGRRHPRERAVRGCGVPVRRRGRAVATPVLLHPDAPAMISHTSGTTGVPKLIVNSAETLWRRFRPQNLLAGLLRTKDPVGFCLSFVHSRLYSGLAVVLERGLPAVIASDPSPANVADLFVQDRPGLVETFPNAFMAW